MLEIANPTANLRAEIGRSGRHVTNFAPLASSLNAITRHQKAGAGPVAKVNVAGSSLVIRSTYAQLSPGFGRGCFAPGVIVPTRLRHEWRHLWREGTQAIRRGGDAVYLLVDSGSSNRRRVQLPSSLCYELEYVVPDPFEISMLGRSVEPHEYGRLQLFPVSKPVRVTFQTAELQALCPVVQGVQPDRYDAEISYTAVTHALESKSVKLWLVSFRDRRVFAEVLAVELHDGVAAFEPAVSHVAVRLTQSVRGGIITTVEYPIRS